MHQQTQQENKNSSNIHLSTLYYAQWRGATIYMIYTCSNANSDFLSSKETLFSNFYKTLETDVNTVIFWF